MKLTLVILFLYICQIYGQQYDPETGVSISKTYKYFSLKTGYSFGSLEKFDAESVFSSPSNPNQKLWTASVIDVSTRSLYPQIGILIGGWRGFIGGNFEFSWLNQLIPEQIVYYDCHGEIFIPPTNDYPDGYYYTISPQDSVDLPEGFLKFNSLSIGGSAFINIDFLDNIKPYVGIGVAFEINNVTSEYPGPGSYAAKNIMAAFGYKLTDAQSLNTTDPGISLKFPIGVKYILSEKLFLDIGTCFSQQYLSFVGSDAYLKEEDSATLQTLQINLGAGFFL